MAILQASMTEEILSRSEKAVIRGIYRASQLAEAKLTLEKVQKSFEAKPECQVDTGDSLIAHMSSLRVFLDNAMRVALVSTKVPGNSQKSTSEVSQPAT